jgi:hypothetical protein
LTARAAALRRASRLGQSRVACASNAPGDMTVGFTPILSGSGLNSIRSRPIQSLDQQRESGELDIFSISCTVSGKRSDAFH